MKIPNITLTEKGSNRTIVVPLGKAASMVAKRPNKYNDVNWPDGMTLKDGKLYKNGGRVTQVDGELKIPQAKQVKESAKKS